MKKENKIAFCIKCGKERPLILNRTIEKPEEILFIGRCRICFTKITLVERADII